MRWYPSKQQLRQSWEKYGLIVVGNIVFFLLLYFISYRPHNTENRASEFLSVAQAAETAGREEGALVVYEKILADYGGTRAAETAAARLPRVRDRLAAPKSEKPELVPPRIDLSEMLERRPAVYVATYLAEHYHEDGADRARIRAAIERYLAIAAREDGVDYRSLSREPEFQSEFFQRELFTARPRCRMTADWLYDDFAVENTNFFAWHNANLEITVRQGDDERTAQRRFEVIAPGQRVEMAELWVSDTGGVVTCRGSLTAEEGSVTWSQEL